MEFFSFSAHNATNITGDYTSVTPAAVITNILSADTRSSTSSKFVNKLSLHDGVISTQSYRLLSTPCLPQIASSAARNPASNQMNHLCTHDEAIGIRNPWLLYSPCLTAAPTKNIKGSSQLLLWLDVVARLTAAKETHAALMLLFSHLVCQAHVWHLPASSGCWCP